MILMNEMKKDADLNHAANCFANEVLNVGYAKLAKTEDERKSVLKMLRAFNDHGVSTTIVMEVFMDIARED